MKKFFLALFLSVLTGARAADVAYDVILPQRPDNNTGPSAARNVAGTANALIGFDGSKHPIPVTASGPISILAGVLSITASSGSTNGYLSSTDWNTFNGKTSGTVVPSTAPTAGQMLVGNAGGTAYAPVSASGDLTVSSTGAHTLATVNSNVGSFGSATAAVTFTVNAKGLITAASSSTITPAVGSITGLGAGVGAALATNTGSAGAPVLFNGAMGTPSSGTVTNLTGTASININGTVGATTPGTGAFTTITATGTITSGSGASTAGAIVMGQGTTASTGTTNITIQAPTGVTSYIRTLPGAVGSTGYVKETVSGSVQTESVVTSIPATDISAGALNIGNNAATVGTVELANGTANTLSASGGVLSIEGVTVDTISATNTLTNKTVDLGVSMGTDDTLRGMIRSGLNNTGGVTQWDVVYLNGSSQWVLADADGSSTYPARGLVTATVSTGGATTVVTRGTVRNDAWTWTPGGTIYLSTTAGGLTQTAPSAAGDKVQVIGYALDADTMAVEPSADYGTAP